MAVVTAVRTRRAPARAVTVRRGGMALAPRGWGSGVRQSGWPDVSFAYERYLAPLCPLERPTDERRYLDIDGAEKEFGHFTKVFANPADWLSLGHLIVVTGDRGYGKTSLIQRCAHWLRTQKQAACEVVVLDMSGEDWPPGHAQRAQRVLNRIIVKVSQYLTDDVIAELKDQKEDLINAFYYLGQALRVRPDANGKLLPPVTLVVLLPGYSEPKEITEYYRLAPPGTFIFAEVFDPVHIGEIETEIRGLHRPGADARQLVTSVLKQGDAERLVAWIQAQRPDGPRLTESVVQERFVNLVKARKLSVSQLSRLAWGVLDVAAAESSDEVTNDHFAKYYERVTYKDLRR
jgi:hypothetical protein